MKKLFLSFLVSLYLPSAVFSGSIFVQPGDRATNMGGAFTAGADDATAIYYNPAGLTQLEGNGFEFTSFYVDSKAKSTSSLQNNSPLTPSKNDFPIPQIYPTERTSYNNKNLTVDAFIPFVAGYTQIEDITLAIGIYGVGGGSGKWSDTVKADAVPGFSDELKASLNSEYGLIVANISGAKRISDQVSIGIGLDVIYMQSELKAKKEYTSNATIITPLNTYEVSVERKGDGYGLEAMGGVLYSPIETLRLGFSIRSGATIKIKGDARYDQVGVYAVLGNPDVHEKTNYTQNYKYPFTYSLGIAYDVTEDLMLAFSADVADYSSMKEDIKYDASGTTFVDINQNLNWKATTMLSLGAKYRLNEAFDLLAGIRRDPSPYNQQDRANLLNTDQYDLTTLTLGTEYKINAFVFGISYAHNFSDKVKDNGAAYEFPSDSLRFGVKYLFY